MPPLRDAELSAAQRAAAAELAAGPRGGVVGPFIAALRSPELMTRLQRLGEYLRYRNALGPRLTELAILITARAWSQPFEWALHVDEAEARGIARATIAAIARHRKPARMPADEAIVYDYLGELHAKQAVSDATYARAVAAFGEAGRRRSHGGRGLLRDARDDPERRAHAGTAGQAFAVGRASRKAQRIARRRGRPLRLRDRVLDESLRRRPRPTGR